MIRWAAAACITTVILVLPVLCIAEDASLQSSVHREVSDEPTRDALVVQSYITGESEELPSAISSRGADHLADVRDLLSGSYYAVLVAAAIGLAGATLFQGVLRRASWLTAGVAVLALATAVWFDAAFYVFHEVFFEGESYLFANSSYLIQLFPQAFFERLGGAVVVGWASCASLVWSALVVSRYDVAG